jgi:YHS domain-containing protein
VKRKKKRKGGEYIFCSRGEKREKRKREDRR